MTILFGNIYSKWAKTPTGGGTVTATNTQVSCVNSNSFLLAFGYCNTYSSNSNGTATWKVGTVTQNPIQIQRIGVEPAKGNYRIWAWYLPNPTPSNGAGNFTFQVGSPTITAGGGFYLMEVFGANLANTTYIYNSSTANTSSGNITSNITAGIGSKIMFSIGGPSSITSYTSTSSLIFTESANKAYGFRAKGTGGTYTFSTVGSGAGTALIQFAIDGIPDTGSQASFMQMF